MRVLFVWPPSVPTYFNAGHRLPLWEVAEYIRRELPDAAVDIVDAGALNYTWKEMADTIIARYDAIAIVNEYDNVDGVRRLVDYARALSPTSRLLTFGRVSSVIPRFFSRYALDAIVRDGDFELGVLQFLQVVRNGGCMRDAQGLIVREDSTWWDTAPGGLCDPSEWAFADPRTLPLELYARLSSRPENRFSALPGKRELTIAVARGCPIGCDYCLVPAYQGLRERRRAVAAVLDYVRAAQDATDFDYVSMYAPTFTLKKQWVRDFCHQIGAVGVPWKCCTSVHHLDRELIALMGCAGCVRISVGLETLDDISKTTLPTLKRVQDNDVYSLARWCVAAGIELNCFVMLGMPGQSREGIRRTFDVVREAGAKLRPTIYTPYQDLSDSVGDADLLAFFTRHITPAVSIDGLGPEEFYAMAFDPDAIP